jgi:hypothetical protein
METTTAELIPRVPADLARPLYSFVYADDPEVRRCERDHGRHKYTLIEVVYEDGDTEVVSFCARCGVPQCGFRVIDADPASGCLLARGHSSETHHRDSRNRWREVAKV